MKQLYQIDLSYACAGIITDNDVVTETAPIFIWMKQKHLNEIKKWVINKRGKITKVKQWN